jgi:hypothetical protein
MAGKKSEKGPGRSGGRTRPRDVLALSAVAPRPTGLPLSVTGQRGLGRITGGAREGRQRLPPEGYGQRCEQYREYQPLADRFIPVFTPPQLDLRLAVLQSRIVVVARILRSSLALSRRILSYSFCTADMPFVG